MRWLTPIILIVVLLTAACGHDPGGKDKIAVIDWDKAFSAHPKQTVLKQGEAELQKLLRYREEQAEIAKTQIAGLTRLQQLKQIIGAKMEPLVVETQARLKQHAEQLQQEMQGDMSGVLSKDQSDLAKVPEALTKAMAAIDKQADKLQESNEKLRAGIRIDIESNVIKLAHERQYTIVFHSVKVNIKADDITDDVVKALQNMK